MADYVIRQSNQRGPQGEAGPSLALAANTIAGNNTGSTADASGLTASQVRNLIALGANDTPDFTGIGIGRAGFAGHIDLYDDVDNVTIEIDAIQNGIQVGGNITAVGRVSAETLTVSAGALTLHSTGIIAGAATVSATEIGYLDGVTSAIQTQIDNKASRNNQVFDDFTTKSTGDLPAANSGQSYTIYPTSGVTRPQIIGGKYSYGAGGNGAYASVQLNQSVTYMMARFTLSSYTTPNGAIALIPWVTPIGTSIAIGQVAQTPAHLVVGAENWSLGTFDGGVATIEYHANEAFPTPLTADGATIHTVEMWIDSAKGVVIIALPNGTIQYVADDKLKVLATYACAEVYRYTPATDAVPAFVSWSASSDPERVAQGYARYAEKLQIAQTYPASDATMTLSGTKTTIPDSTKMIFVPPSGRMLLTISLFLDITSDGLAFVSLNSGATELETIAIGTKTTHSGPVVVMRYVNLSAYAGQGLSVLLKAVMYGGAGTVIIQGGGSNAMAVVYTLQAV